MPSNIECYVQSAKTFIKRNNKYVQIAVTIIAIIAALLFFVMNGEKSAKVDNDKAPSISRLKESQSKKRSITNKSSKSKISSKDKS